MFLNYPVPKDSATAWRLPSELTVRRPIPALRRTIPVPARALLVILALFTSMNAVCQMSAVDAANALGDLREGERYNAIAAVARTGQIRSPVSAADGAAILQGTTQVLRSASIARLASLFKADLSGAEAATILGTEAILSEGNRYNAITALARAERFGPSLAEDVALALQGTTQVSRAAAISQIAPYLRPAISGRAVATVLGSARLLDEGSRYNAIAALARSARAKQPLAPVDVVSILDGTTQVSRAAAISQLATWIAVGLSGDDAAAILGRGGELTEGNRYNAIAALARAGRFRGSLTGDEMAAILQGTTGQSRAAAITKIASAAMRQIASLPITGTPLPLGGAPLPSTTAGTTPTTTGAVPKAVGDGSPLPPLSIDDMRKLADAYAYAQLSEAVYTVPYLIKTQSRLGDQIWKRVAVEPGSASGFKAAAYLSRDGRTCVVAFAGTDFGFSWEAVRDLDADFNQWLSRNPSKVPLQYAKAEAFVLSAVAGPCKQRNVNLTGHSLGGGLAQYSYLRTGRAYPAYTFNAAGLAPLSLAYQVANLGKNERISNFYSVSYDASAKLIGRDVVSLTGVTLGTETEVPVNGWRIATHRMTVLREAMGVYRDRCRLDPTCR